MVIDRHIGQPKSRADLIQSPQKVGILKPATLPVSFIKTAGELEKLSMQHCAKVKVRTSRKLSFVMNIITGQL